MEIFMSNVVLQLSTGLGGKDEYVYENVRRWALKDPYIGNVWDKDLVIIPVHLAAEVCKEMRTCFLRLNIL